MLGDFFQEFHISAIYRESLFLRQIHDKVNLRTTFKNVLIPKPGFYKIPSFANHFFLSAHTSVDTQVKLTVGFFFQSRLHAKLYFDLVIQKSYLMFILKIFNQIFYCLLLRYLYERKVVKVVRYLSYYIYSWDSKLERVREGKEWKWISFKCFRVYSFLSVSISIRSTFYLLLRIGLKQFCFSVSVDDMCCPEDVLFSFLENKTNLYFFIIICLYVVFIRLTIFNK